MKPAAILDIGSSKAVCLSGSVLDKGGIVVHGAGVSGCEGYLGNTFPDKQSLHDAIIDAVQKAEQEARSRIRDVALTVPAAFSKLVLSDMTMTLGEHARVVEPSDVDRLIELSFRKIGTPEGYVLMHSTPVFFLVDGISSAEMPQGIMTEEISGLIAHMFVEEAYIATIQQALDDIGVEISMCISAALGEATMLIPETERVRPAVLIDVGYRQTDICVIENAALTGLATIPMGGYQFASDLAFGLDVTQQSAEQAKRRFVFSLDYGDKTEILRSESESKRVANSTIAYIIEARANDLAAHIREELDRLQVNLESRPVVYLSGGGFLMMRGSLDFLKKALGFPIKRDMPWTPRLSSPNYCSAFGALNFVLRANRTDDRPQEPAPDETGFWQKLKDFFTK
ncbi:MAG: hypothetical protein IJK12_01295 [Clostridia bacterium]|jgi:cell division protein FtsA|nr:hypothetical protein [Clostridia bacterium]MBR0435860.1 hypothetical protein [Clostridia bacterium]MBR3037738.1 hypothetical protein [Clostridia bacterium]MBR3130353.1 hypothetical protein [Clostridia bacterium]